MQSLLEIFETGGMHLLYVKTSTFLILTGWMHIEFTLKMLEMNRITFSFIGPDEVLSRLQVILGDVISTIS